LRNGALANQAGQFRRRGRWKQAVAEGEQRTQRQPHLRPQAMRTAIQPRAIATRAWGGPAQIIFAYRRIVRKFAAWPVLAARQPFRERKRDPRLPGDGSFVD
jgi:hypothetical protein